ncbi:PilT/PilU family type 4a pilus ATPase [Prosthecobacter sp.]|uniref:type IV pilus twitching motility protein PilT n=1 Tax=Prosthecobacter sp. TaxID=1965333 RepID=UPI00248787B4|nr:PilT/PilU family type 4a pilus ATPase [Prosthecobacter sp.]MDI1312482.1 PilT/PilU family type 4a pilus ATPase [Prosthecobacter sp.]
MSAAALHLESLLDRCLDIGASDMHLAHDAPPYFRVQGMLTADESLPRVSEAQMEHWARDLTGQASGPVVRENGSYDGALTSMSGVRFRFNIYKVQSRIHLALRRLDDHFRPLSELGLPESLNKLCLQPYGLVVIAGPTGSGKTTTLATLLDHINQTRRCHLITIEDPVEYVHESKIALVNQRQLGLDTPSFNDALVASMRQDPDVILVGEIRDLTTIRTAITAAETGHLVFTTVHAGDCVGAIERMVSVFPAGEQDGIRRQLALVLRAVVAQHLLVADGSARKPRNNGNGEAEMKGRRVLAAEILIANQAVANLIATGKSNLIYSAMESGMQQGMQTMEHSLASLYLRGDISEQTVNALSRQPAQVFERASRMRTRSTESA